MQLPPFEYHHPEAKPRNPGNPETHHVPYKKPSRLFLKPRHPCEGCMIWLCQSTWLANSWRFLNHWVMQATQKIHVEVVTVRSPIIQPPECQAKTKKNPSRNILFATGKLHRKLQLHTHLAIATSKVCMCVCVCVFVCIFGAPKE